MNNKGANGYPTGYDAAAAQQAAYQQYMNGQMSAQAQLPPSYNSVMTSMAPTYQPYPPGIVPQPFYGNASWSVNPSPQAQFAPPPPPYAATPGSVTAIPAQTVHHQPMYQYQIAAAPPPNQPAQLYQTPVYPVQGAMFDAGARFGKSGGQPTIPPPPPGLAPTGAQLASMQGQQVVLAKKKSSFLGGGGGAGYTFW